MKTVAPAPTLPKESSLLPKVGSRDERISERACRRIIARHRIHLDCLLRVPEWEALYAKGLAELGLPQPRRGINLRAVLDSLLIENKFQLISWSLGSSPDPVAARTAFKLSEQLGLDLWTAKELDQRLTLTQWQAFLEKARFSLNREHRSYKRAQTILFRRYQSLLHKLVNRMVFDPGKRADGAQEASLGLIHAIDKVEDNEASFGSYARSWIGRHIKNFLMGEHFPVHVPINLASRILREKPGASDHKGRTSSSSTPELHRGTSLDQMMEDQENGPSRMPSDPRATPSERLSEKDILEAVKSLMAQLTDKQREVLELRFGLRQDGQKATLATIAAQCGISYQQVSMREKRALEKLESILKPLYEEAFH